MKLLLLLLLSLPLYAQKTITVSLDELLITPKEYAKLSPLKKQVLSLYERRNSLQEKLDRLRQLEFALVDSLARTDKILDRKTVLLRQTESKPRSAKRK